MPRVLGVIAEYNPFHLGHAYHLRRARELSGADYVVVVMSTCFTQRGEAALLAPAARAEMALRCGADAVFALPAVWAVRDAEHFALGGAAILNNLGCDAISFGSEHADLSLLQNTARLLDTPDEAFHTALQSRTASGLPYPAAVAGAAEEQLPGAGALLSSPNSTLAICYLRALMQLGSHMEVFPVARTAAYHDTALTDAMPSATALRGAILRGDWRSTEAAMPPEAFRVLHTAALTGKLHRPNALEQALLYKLRTMTDEEYAALPDISEGIEYRLRTAALSSHSRETMLQTAKTRRYPHARLSRLAAHALLGMTHAQFQSMQQPEAAWLLGFRKDAAPLIRHLSSVSLLPIITRSSEHDMSASWFITEVRAHDVWALGSSLPAGLALSQKLTVI